jgi:phospholipid transport system substrate-binding protein
MIQVRPSRCVTTLVAACVLCTAATAQADDAIKKPLETLVKSVRYSKDDRALKQLDGEAQGKILLADDWDKATPDQRNQFVSYFHQLFAVLAFPKIRESLQYLGTTLYEEPTITGDKAQIVSTLAIDHPLKKQELKVKYDLHRTKEGWKVVDLLVLGVGGDSMLTGIRNDQIIPNMKDGLPKLLELMQQRLQQVQKK